MEYTRGPQLPRQSGEVMRSRNQDSSNASIVKHRFAMERPGATILRLGTRLVAVGRTPHADSIACGIAFGKGNRHMSHLLRWDDISQAGMHLTPGLRGTASATRVYILAGGGAIHPKMLPALSSLLIVWVLWACLVVVLASVLLLWRCWPTLLRQSHCAWCWKMLRIMRWYPRRWSSTICYRHARQIRAASAARHTQHQRILAKQTEVNRNCSSFY
jgi:hypothetical protein